jgi:predicted MFS family arabinose efflux permease
MTVSPPQLPRVFTGLRLTLGLVVLGQSLATATSASGLTGGSHHNPALLVLAAIEAIAALLFLLPHTTGPAAATLVGIFAVAIAAVTVVAVHDRTAPSHPAPIDASPSAR